MTTRDPIDVETSEAAVLIDLENIRLSWRRTYRRSFLYTDICWLCELVAQRFNTTLGRVVVFMSRPEECVSTYAVSVGSAVATNRTLPMQTVSANPSKRNEGAVQCNAANSSSAGTPSNMRSQLGATSAGPPLASSTLVEEDTELKDLQEILANLKADEEYSQQRRSGVAGRKRKLDESSLSDAKPPRPQKQRSLKMCDRGALTKQRFKTSSITSFSNEAASSLQAISELREASGHSVLGSPLSSGSSSGSRSPISLDGEGGRVADDFASDVEEYKGRLGHIVSSGDSTGGSDGRSVATSVSKSDMRSATASPDNVVNLDDEDDEEEGAYPVQKSELAVCESGSSPPLPSLPENPVAFSSPPTAPSSASSDSCFFSPSDPSVPFVDQAASQKSSSSVGSSRSSQSTRLSSASDEGAGSSRGSQHEEVCPGAKLDGLSSNYSFVNLSSCGKASPPQISKVADMGSSESCLTLDDNDDTWSVISRSSMSSLEDDEDDENGSAEANSAATLCSRSRSSSVSSSASSVLFTVNSLGIPFQPPRTITPVEQTDGAEDDDDVVEDFGPLVAPSYKSIKSSALLAGKADAVSRKTAERSGARVRVFSRKANRESFLVPIDGSQGVTGPPAKDAVTLPSRGSDGIRSPPAPAVRLGRTACKGCEVVVKVFGYKLSGRRRVQRCCDVAIGNELTKLCFMGRFNNIVLFSADSDFQDTVSSCRDAEDYGGVIKYAKTIRVLGFRQSFGSSLLPVAYEQARRRAEKAAYRRRGARVGRSQPVGGDDDDGDGSGVEYYIIEKTFPEIREVLQRSTRPYLPQPHHISHHHRHTSHQHFHRPALPPSQINHQQCPVQSQNEVQSSQPLEFALQAPNPESPHMQQPQSCHSHGREVQAYQTEVFQSESQQSRSHLEQSLPGVSHLPLNHPLQSHPTQSQPSQCQSSQSHLTQIQSAQNQPSTFSHSIGHIPQQYQLQTPPAPMHQLQVESSQVCIPAQPLANAPFSCSSISPSSVTSAVSSTYPQPPPESLSVACPYTLKQPQQESYDFNAQAAQILQQSMVQLQSPAHVAPPSYPPLSKEQHQEVAPKFHLHVQNMYHFRPANEYDLSSLANNRSHYYPSSSIPLPPAGQDRRLQPSLSVPAPPPQLPPAAPSLTSSLVFPTRCSSLLTSSTH